MTRSWTPFVRVWNLPCQASNSLPPVRAAASHVASQSSIELLLEFFKIAIKLVFLDVVCLSFDLLAGGVRMLANWRFDELSRQMSTLAPVSTFQKTEKRECFIGFWPLGRKLVNHKD